MYNTEQNTLSAEYSLSKDPDLKDIAKQKRIESAKEFENMHLMGKPWLNKEIQHVKKWSKIFYDTFKKLNIHTNETSVNFSLINFDKVKKTSKQVFHALAKAGILLRQMDVYLIKNSLRVTVGNSNENLKLIIKLKKILNV